MRIREVELYNYRNYDYTKLSPFEGTNIFLGKNGQGKTNFIESIFLLSQGQSFRPTQLNSLVNYSSAEQLTQASTTSIKVILKNSSMVDQVKMVLWPKKKILLNEKQISPQKIQSKMPIVLFSPESLLSIKEGPELRRSLVDNFLSSFNPTSIEIIRLYKRILKQRNIILKSVKSGNASKQQAIEILSALRPNFIKLATQLTLLRIEALKSITPLLTSVLKSIFLKENVDISVDYFTASGNSLNKLSQEEIGAMFETRENELLSQELATGNSLVGPHKHDIQFTINNKNARYYCSQGQQRAIILSFKMAQIMYHYQAYKTYPILLLDDVLSELDEEKRMTLIEFLGEIEAQIFITSTELPSQSDVFKKAAIYQVHQGKIIQTV